MIDQVPLTKIEYIMLKEIAKKNRKKPLDYLREWMASEHSKVEVGQREDYCPKPLPGESTDTS